MKSCSTDSCYLIDINTIDEMIYSVKDRIITLSDDQLNRLKTGMACSRAENLELTKLSIYKNSLQRAWDSLYNGLEPCIPPADLQQLIENVKGLVDISCCDNGRLDCLVDTSSVEDHVFGNPQCQSYDAWNKWTKKWCFEIGFNIHVEEMACQVMFNIAKDIIPCDILFALQVKKEMCDLGYKVTRSEEECKYDWKILVEKTDCEIDFKTYRKLIDCGFSYDIVKTVIDANCTLEIVGEGECGIELKTITGNFNICDITPEDLQSVERFAAKISVKEEDLKGDYGKIDGSSPL